MAQNPCDSGVTVQHRSSSYIITKVDMNVWSHSALYIPVCYCFLKEMHTVPVCFWFEAWNKQKGYDYLVKPLYSFIFQDFSFPQKTSVHFLLAISFSHVFSVSCPLNAILLETWLIHSRSRFIPEFSFCVSWDEGEEHNEVCRRGQGRRVGCCVSPQSGLKILSSKSGGLWWPHSIWICHWLFYIYTWTLGQTFMKIKKTIIFTILKRSLLLIVPSHDAILFLPAWGQSSLIFELPPETYHNSITQKSEVTLQRRRLHFLALNLMCKHSYRECNHGNKKKKRRMAVMKA